MVGGDEDRIQAAIIDGRLGVKRLLQNAVIRPQRDLQSDAVTRGRGLKAVGYQIVGRVREYPEPKGRQWLQCPTAGQDTRNCLSERIRLGRIQPMGREMLNDAGQVFLIRGERLASRAIVGRSLRQPRQFCDPHGTSLLLPSSSPRLR